MPKKKVISLIDIKNHFSFLHSVKENEDNPQCFIFYKDRTETIQSTPSKLVYAGFIPLEIILKCFFEFQMQYPDETSLELKICPSFDTENNFNNYSWINNLDGALIEMISLGMGVLFDCLNNNKTQIHVSFTKNKIDCRTIFIVPLTHIDHFVNKLCESDTNILVSVSNTKLFHPEDNKYLRQLISKLSVQRLACNSIMIEDFHSDRLFELSLVDFFVNISKLTLPYLSKLTLECINISKETFDVIESCSNLNTLTIKFTLNDASHLINTLLFMKKNTQIKEFNIIIKGTVTNVAKWSIENFIEVMTNLKILRLHVKEKITISLKKIPQNYELIELRNIDIDDVNIELFAKASCRIIIPQITMPKPKKQELIKYMDLFPLNLNLVLLIDQCNIYSLQCYKYVLNTLLNMMTLQQKITDNYFNSLFVVYKQKIEYYMDISYKLE